MVIDPPFRSAPLAATIIRLAFAAIVIGLIIRATIREAIFQAINIFGMIEEVETE